MKHSDNPAVQELYKMGQAAQKASQTVRLASPQLKNEALELMADALIAHGDAILAANAQDLQAGADKGLAESFLERLTLNEDRILGMANGLRKIAKLEDPLQRDISRWTNEDGLRITQRRVPLGVVGIIYESRPNVTSDASGLCLKAGNAVILRGGSDALNSNQAILAALKEGLAKSQIPVETVQLIVNPDRELASEFMRMDQYVDCLIPRGGAGLIKTVTQQATIPVIETGVGNDHIYVHEAADLAQAQEILVNAKTQRPSTCNTVETVLVDDKLAKDHLDDLLAPLIEKGVEIRACDRARQYSNYDLVVVTEEDYHEEFLELILALRVVDGYDQAVEHVQEYSSQHSDAILTQNYEIAQRFMNDIDSAVVYVNASTRFTDGEIFGLGGEIGISTQKLHARGPMGLEALTSYKYTVEGQGQIRS